MTFQFFLDLCLLFCLVHSLNSPNSGPPRPLNLDLFQFFSFSAYQSPQLDFPKSPPSTLPHLLSLGTQIPCSVLCVHLHPACPCTVRHPRQTWKAMRLGVHEEEAWGEMRGNISDPPHLSGLITTALWISFPRTWQILISQQMEMFL